MEVRTATFGLEVAGADEDEEAIVAAILFRYSLPLGGAEEGPGRCLRGY